MLIIVLNPDQESLYARWTEDCARQLYPEARILTADHAFEDLLQRAASDHPESDYIMILFAGERLERDFRLELSDLLQRMPDSCGYIHLQSVHDPGSESLKEARGPAVWRREILLRPSASQQGLHTLAAVCALPFERYVLKDIQYRVSSSWKGEVLRTGSYLPSKAPIRRWRRLDEEWRLLQPLLSASLVPLVSDERPPLITVVICTYNDRQYVHWAIRSVLAQKLRCWELLLMDDGSTDGTYEELMPYASHPSIKLLRHSTNSGKAASLNTALSHARGSWLLELDADDWLTADCLSELEAAALLHPQAGFLFARHFNWLEQGAATIYQGAAPLANPLPLKQLLDRAEPLAPRCYRVAALKELSGWWHTGPQGGRLYEDFQMIGRLLQAAPAASINRVLYHRRLRQNSITHRHHALYDSWKQLFLSELDQ
ncbi:glycosyltransferase family A protein [Paenibacillus sp. YYML68]|uniref:glycosyltransferase family 2 protein n=1 Tax=Paenibacillus sp. YYML68 TaxID=2909250 RepID=UPI002490DED8|nr:glycosyltransferase family A protein [Paenibacillus sp. YYML68]